jgi:phosphatidylserine/phosphatidylglycerophosphate/cardiolipin synthase-like enzyme
VSINAMRRLPRRRIAVAAFALLWLAVGVWQTLKPMPAGTAVDSGNVRVSVESIEFLHDLTYGTAAGDRAHEQQIFDSIFAIIDQAHTTLVLDFFLFNDQAGSSNNAFRALSRELAEHLLARKRAVPSLQVVVVTDPINDVYGGAPSPILQELTAAGIDVVVTDLRRLRDSNPAYSSVWRIFVQWWGNSPAISWLPNPFADGPSRISLRSWLSLLNFKANHRKVIVADRADGEWVGLVTSGNPHDASSGHSNVALRFSGSLALKVLESELDVARFSGWSGSIDVPASPALVPDPGPQMAFVTEMRIRDRMLGAIEAASQGDEVSIAMFYFSDRLLIRALKDAANRGARVRLILDPNKDAFGIEKDGVPNRPVARELLESTGGAIAVRWYQTRGEQFHTKLVMVTRGERLTASLGSANLTRRNLGNYNLEANVEIELFRDAPLALEMQGYFARLWNNEGGMQYTVPYDAYRDDSALRYWRYRLMEATGLSTF